MITTAIGNHMAEAKKNTRNVAMVFVKRIMLDKT